MNDVWDADEFGLFNIIAPDTTIGARMLPIRKELKYSVTLLAYKNTDGSENFPLLIIEGSQPKFFGFDDPKSLRIMLLHNRKT